MPYTQDSLGSRAIQSTCVRVTMAFRNICVEPNSSLSGVLEILSDLSDRVGRRRKVQFYQAANIHLAACAKICSNTSDILIACPMHTTCQ